MFHNPKIFKYSGSKLSLYAQSKKNDGTRSFNFYSFTGVFSKYKSSLLLALWLTVQSNKLGKGMHRIILYTLN